MTSCSLGKRSNPLSSYLVISQYDYEFMLIGSRVWLHAAGLLMKLFVRNLLSIIYCNL